MKLFFFYDATEQFNVYFFLLFNNVFFITFLISLLIMFLFLMINDKANLNIAVNCASNLISNAVKVNVYGNVKIFYMPFYLTLFFVIVISNLVGLVPLAFTASALLILPFFFSFINFIFTTLIMLEKWGFFFFAGFLPNGTNIFIAPLLTLIEIVSHFVKLISLAVRLFANLFAGHVLIKVLLSLILVLILGNTFLFYVLAGGLFFLVSAILCLEIFICCLQAYVFINLGSIYLNQALTALEH